MQISKVHGFCWPEGLEEKKEGESEEVEDDGMLLPRGLELHGQAFTFDTENGCRKYLEHIEKELDILYCSEDAEWFCKFEKTFFQLQELLESDERLTPCGKLFTLLKEESNKIKKSKLHAGLSTHRTKNRYTNNHPFDENRVIFDKESSYVNASYIALEQLYIAAQGPLKNTRADFWNALCATGAKTLVTIVMPFEKLQEKCDAFWDDNIFPLQVGDFEIQKQTEDEPITSCLDPKERIVLRHFLIYNLKTKEQRSFVQYHYENWPDFGVSSDISLFCQLLKLLSKEESSNLSPMWVNCSAGLGRTGTFIACHSEYKRLKDLQKSGCCQNSYSLNVVKKILSMRLQRYDLLQSPEQLEFFIRVVLKLCEESLE